MYSMMQSAPTSTYSLHILITQWFSLLIQTPISTTSSAAAWNILLVLVALFVTSRLLLLLQLLLFVLL